MQSSFTPSKQAEIIWTKAIFNLRSESHHNYLSYLWWIIEPALYMAVYNLVFGTLLNYGGKDYPVFLLTGLIPWMWFMKSVSGSCNSLITNQALILQASIPCLIFPLTSLLQSLIKQTPVFFLLVGFLWISGITPQSHWWALVPVIFVQLLLIIAFSCAVAALIPFIRDLHYLVPTGLTLLMFLSGVFYSLDSMSTEWQGVFLLNPVAFLLHCYREIFLSGILPDLNQLALWGGINLAACASIGLLYNKLRYAYPRIITG